MPIPLIMVAPNGARKTKKDHPNLPVDLDEIVATAKSCFVAGARALHLHVRDEQGRHSLDAGRYNEAIAALGGAVPEMQVQITTESAGLYGPQVQFDCLAKVSPEWASVSVREINRDPDAARGLYHLCSDQGTRVQHIAYDTTDIALLHRWRREGVVPLEQDEVICVLGTYEPPRAGTQHELSKFVAATRDLRFSVCTFGASEQTCLTLAAASGAEILRVGFENNLTAPGGALWRSNADAVSSLKACFERNAA